MDEDGRRSPDPGQDHGHRGHRGSNANANANANSNGNARRSLYRMSSNQSRSSIFEDVEMAHEEVMMKYTRTSRIHSTVDANYNFLSFSLDLSPKVFPPVYRLSPIEDLAPIRLPASLITMTRTKVSPMMTMLRA